MPFSHGDPILKHISAMNQRGGRFLLLIDLIEAGTLSAAPAGRLICLRVRSAYYSYLWGKEIADYFSLADGQNTH